MINYRDAKIKFFSPLVKNKKVLDLGIVQHNRQKYFDDNWQRER